MTDQRERVDDMDALVKRIISSSYSEGYYYQQNARVRAILVTALADAERRGIERAAKVVDKMAEAYSTDRCVDTKELSIICQEECVKVAASIRAQADQEEG